MCYQNPLMQKNLQMTETQAEKLKQLEDKNREAARKLLLQVQLQLSRQSIQRKL
jgi:hypothetical protein